MNKTPRLIPIWFLPVLVLITFWIITCQGCRGGRSLGKGSAGTIIVPQTPQQINERNRQPPPKIVLPPLEPLAPIPIVPPKTTPVAPRVPSKAVRSTPTLPESNSVEANPVIINPKPAGKPKPFSPTVSTTPVKLPPAPKLIEGDGGCVIITGSEKNEATDSKATDSKSALGDVDNRWDKLIYYYLFLFIAMILGWVVYDIVQTYRLRKELGSKAQVKKKTVKKPAKGTRASRKKALSKKNEKPK